MPSSPPSRFTRPALAIWLATLAIVLAARILGPSDLGQNLDQSKTIAFTLDMVNHNQWILPRDGLGRLTRKPPMVNWVAAPIVAMGFHNELALKLPAVLSGVSISILIFFAARFLFRRLNTDSETDPADPADEADQSIAAHATPLAMLTAAAWLASPSAIKHIYFMRPDILFTALLAGGWFASLILLTSSPKHPRRLALLIWLAAAAALLTKGPLAALIPLYLLLHILIITPKGSRKQAFKRTGWQWGIPIMLILPAGWLWSAYELNPEHVRTALLGQELGSRMGRGGFSGIIEAALHNPAYFFERFLPWCLPAVLAITFKPSRRIRSHAMGPAVLWILLVFAATTLAGMNAGSYIMPAYPPAAILAVYALYRLGLRSNPARVFKATRSIAAFILISAALIAGREMTMSRGARDHTGQNIKAFAYTVAQHIQSDPVRFNQMGDLPIASLLGKHQPGDTAANASHRWLIQPTSLNPSTTPILTSAPLTTHNPTTGEPIANSITISLYRLP